MGQGAPACPSVEAGPDVTTCSGQCSTLSATLVTNNQTTSYSVAAIPYIPFSYTTGTAILVATDDVWSPVENIGFNFCFFGTSYSKFVIGANGHVTFNLAKAFPTTDNYQVTTPLPSTADMPANTINAVFRDIDPALGGAIYYKMYGSAPCRAMVVSWDNVPLFDKGSGTCDGTPNSTFQLVFYENTNFIDVYIGNSFSCAAWENGKGIVGLMNSTATTAVCPPGRNCTAFTTTNEAWRFTPTGAPSYTLNWYEVGSVVSLGTAPTLSVCPTTTTTYVAEMIVTNCDGSHITVDDSVTVNIAGTLAVTPTSTDITCHGANDGTAAAGASSGTTPYTYSWAPSGGTAATASSLAGGTYTCTVTDHGGCSLPAVVTIADPVALSATGTPATELCVGGSTATVSVNPSGGTGAYTYAWAAAGGTGQTSTALAAGNYTCTITDNNGCHITQVETISDPAALSSTGTPGSAACGGTSTVSVNPSGGTGAYTYSWAAAGGTGQTSTALPAGNYTCTITDHNGCSTTQVEAISPVAGPTATGTPGVAICNGTATVSVNPSGGTGAYTYSWAAAGGNGQTSTPLPAGTYTCTITDHNGCSTTQVESVTSSAGPSATGTPGVATCGGGTATVSVNATGGTGAYTYSWAAAGGTGQTSTPLPVGTYTCTITDNAGCSTTQIEAVTAPTALTATNSQTNILCNGASTGTATVNPSGGTGAYTFSWAPSGGTAATASGLSASSFVCTITDNNGCSTTSGVTITQPGIINLSTSTVPAACGISNGTATVIASGGAGGFSYAWTPAGGNAATTTGVAAATYTITVHDANACPQSTTVAIGNTGGPTAVIGASTNILCHGGSNGSATVTTAGGTLPYTFSWSPSGGTAATASGLSFGAYTATVTDNGGCQATAVANLTEPAALSVTNAKVDASCFGGNNGTASVNVSGGTGTYTYSWAPSGGAAFSATGLVAGNYTCNVTDHNGCPDASVVVVGQPAAVSGTIVHTDELCKGAATASATMSPAGGTGAYTFSWTPSGGAAATATGLIAGTYTCTVTDANGCSNPVPVTIAEPVLLSGSTIFTAATCGNSNGTATAQPTGGTGAYTYSWNPGAATTATASALLPGTYTCTVTDANNCTVVLNATIPNQAGPVLAVSALANVTCNGACNGSVTVAATGGTGALTYSWFPSGGTAVTAAALCPGIYTCTVTDANGCFSSANANIRQSSPIVLSIPVSKNVLCNGGNTGSATASASGGTGVLNYSWTPSGGNAPVATGLTPGLYTVTVKDVSGCTLTDTITITQPALLTVSAAGIATTCNGKCDGTLICIPAGGVTPYAYSWNTGCTSASCNNACAGTYTIVVTDANNCTVSSTTTVTQPSPVVLSMFTQAAHCFHSDGSDSVSASGGTPVYAYSWSPGVGSALSAYHAIPPGMYVVTVTDKKGCAIKDSIQVPNTSGVVASIVGTTANTCFGGSNGAAQGAGTGGTFPYSFSWTPGTSVSDTALNLPAGSYTIQVSDAKGCNSTAVAIVGQPTQVVALPMPPVTVCIGQCLSLTSTGSGGNAGYAFSWTTSAGPSPSPVCPLVTTTYTVIATDKNGCLSAPANTTITVNPPLHVIATHDTAMCPGGTTILQATASGGNGNYSYTWSTALGLSSSTIPTPSATPASTTIYTVSLSDNCGTPVSTDTVNVTIYAQPVVVFAASDTSGCAPLCISFSEISLPACANAVWNFGDGTTGNGCAKISHCFTKSGLYSISINETDIHGCPASISVPNYINVYPVPEAAFKLGPQPATIVNSDIRFSDQSTGASAWLWNFGDLGGATSVLQNPNYVYPDTGCFTAMLITANTFGCLDTAYAPLCIRPDFTFYAPNAFTPNGDGVNDVWMPKGLGIDPATYHIMMFDRWGNLLWETRTWGQGWDGRANNGSNI